jgi:2-polyprenyl-6-methoxyphenol hydroxylase-like FAD-dependent oxidoreductase
MSEVERVVIVGGGVGGLAAAVGLRRAGIEVEVHEKYDHLARRASALTLWSYAIKSLRELGISEPERFGAPIDVAEIRERDGTRIEEIPVGAVSRELGAPSYEVDRRLFREACLELLGDGVVRMGSECVGIEQHEREAIALLADGGRAAGDLVIGADGAHSVTRGAVAAEPQLRYAGYSAWAGVLESFEHPLLGPNRHIEIWAEGSIGGVADLGQGRARWYVTHDSRPGAKWGEVDKRAVLEHVAGWYELLPAAVAAAEASSMVTMEAWELEPLPSWIDRRLVLLGDSAHLTTPSVSGGACTTIEDAAALTRLLAGATPLPESLRRFERERKRKDERMVRRSRWAGKLQHLRSPTGRWLRDHAIEHLPESQARRIVARMAAGS